MADSAENVMCPSAFALFDRRLALEKIMRTRNSSKTHPLNYDLFHPVGSSEEVVQFLPDRPINFDPKKNHGIIDTGSCIPE